MSLCKGVEDEVEKISKIVDFKVSKEIIGSIAENTESFILQILEESSNICKNDKRKIVTLDDLKQAVFTRKIEFLQPLFD